MFVTDTIQRENFNGLGRIKLSKRLHKWGGYIKDASTIGYSATKALYYRRKRKKDEEARRKYEKYKKKTERGAKGLATVGAAVLTAGAAGIGPAAGLMSGAGSAIGTAATAVGGAVKTVGSVVKPVATSVMDNADTLLPVAMAVAANKDDETVESVQAGALSKMNFGSDNKTMLIVGGIGILGFIIYMNRKRIFG